MNRTPRPLVRLLLLAACAVLCLVFLDHYAPLQVPSTLFWGSALVGLAGLLSLVRPLRFLLIPTRAAGAVLLVAAAAVAVSALCWPVSTIRAAGPHQRLDDFLPEYQFHELHETEIAATPDQVARAVREVRFSDMPSAVALMRVRAMASGQFDAPPPNPRPLLDTFKQPGSGFLALDESRPGEWVGGMAGRPWASRGGHPPVKTPGQFLAFDAPGHVKVAFNMRWQDAGNGRTRLSTETRIAGTDAGARRTFARYWRVIYPGSAIIRRVWLDAIARRAEAQ